MKNSLPKKHRYTTITFNEDSDLIDVITFNTSLKNRLTEFQKNIQKSAALQTVMITAAYPAKSAKAA